MFNYIIFLFSCVSFGTPTENTVHVLCPLPPATRFLAPLFAEGEAPPSAKQL